MSLVDLLRTPFSTAVILARSGGVQSENGKSDALLVYYLFSKAGSTRGQMLSLAYRISRCLNDTDVFHNLSNTPIISFADF
jgi:hypothetical protein